MRHDRIHLIMTVVSIVFCFGLIGGLSAQEPPPAQPQVVRKAELDHCDEMLARAVKRRGEAGLDSFSCGGNGQRVSWSCKCQGITLTLGDQPAKLVVYAADGTEIGSVHWPPDTFTDTTIRLEYREKK